MLSICCHNTRCLSKARQIDGLYLLKILILCYDSLAQSALADKIFEESNRLFYLHFLHFGKGIYVLSSN